MDRDCPDVDTKVECQVQVLVQWEKKCIHMIGDALYEAVDWVESKARKWCRHLPLVMRLVDVFVNQRIMKPTMDPVDHQVSK